LSGPGIDFPLTVQECVLHGRYATAPSWRGFGADDKKMADMALAEVELTALATRDVRTLSSGERHRVAMARLLAQDPWLLLIDEAVEHLDLYYRMRLLERLREHSRRPGRAGRFGAVGLVLHDINLAARYCDHLLCLFPDGQTWHGATPSFLQTDRLRQLFRYPLVAMEGPTGTAWLPV
jgi:iron complex transport system ATP-binding protein